MLYRLKIQIFLPSMSVVLRLFEVSVCNGCSALVILGGANKLDGPS